MERAVREQGLLRGASIHACNVVRAELEGQKGFGWGDGTVQAHPSKPWLQNRTRVYDTPAIDHRQHSGRGSSCGLGMKALVRKVNYTLVEMASDTRHPLCTKVVRRPTQGIRLGSCT